ncbi:MAG: hypothetical protein J0I12_32215 [Candidatus Eremiobacteraeota bacterium]|nr:hypothetical protein [Candidatus Eremiobacteraeota bacterium]
MQNLHAGFQDYKLAEKAVGALLDHGVPKENISLIGPADGKDHEKHAEHGITTTTGADAAAGAAKGAGAGLVAGALGALASLFIPGFGIVTGGGALATALATAAGTTAAGAVAGSVAGFLQDQGVDQQVAQDYQKAIEHGGALIQVVTPAKDVPTGQIQEILTKYGATNFAGIAPRTLP